VKQSISFVRSKDGVRIACARSGEGPPVVRAATWMTHLELDWESAIWGHWFRFLSEQHTLVRYDERGCGLSERNLRSISFDGWVADLEAVVDAMGLERFPLLGMSQGAGVAIEYAARHPERVSQLVLFGGFAAGWQHADKDMRDHWHAIRELVRVGWGDENPAFRSMFGYLFVPDADPDAIRWYAELAQRSCDRRMATAIIDVFGSLNVAKRMRQVTAPTLVVHSEQDSLVPMDAGRVMAEAIPAARFAGLDSRNHLLIEDEPSWGRFRELFTDFVTEAPRARRPHRTDFSSLTTRERQILAQLADGLSNGQIAQALFISEKTVRNHVSSILDKLGVESRARAIVLARDASFRA
jgi:pimeloyl-ACP methyl ester carboxylesterase/DNA-binding CsgD family transcriptional regulator